MAQTEPMLECLGGPLCGTKVPDYKELWLTIQSVENEEEQHFYKRIKMISLFRQKSVLVWHYHGTDPDMPGVPILRPHPRKFR